MSGSNKDDQGDGYEARLEEAKRASMLQVLFKSARLLNSHAISRVRARIGQPGLREAHMALFPHIDLEGVRLTELASRLGISKQAVAQLVNEMVEMGSLERVPDPSDGRAKLIRFSAMGREGILHGLSMLRELEGELAELVGAEALEQTHQTLLTILAHAEANKDQG